MVQIMERRLPNKNEEDILDFLDDMDLSEKLDAKSSNSEFAKLGLSVSKEEEKRADDYLAEAGFIDDEDEVEAEAAASKERVSPPAPPRPTKKAPPPKRKAPARPVSSPPTGTAARKAPPLPKRRKSAPPPPPRRSMQEEEQRVELTDQEKAMMVRQRRRPLPDVPRAPSPEREAPPLPLKSAVETPSKVNFERYWKEVQDHLMKIAFFYEKGRRMKDQYENRGEAKKAYGAFMLTLNSMSTNAQDLGAKFKEMSKAKASNEVMRRALLEIATLRDDVVKANDFFFQEIKIINDKMEAEIKRKEETQLVCDKIDEKISKLEKAINAGVFDEDANVKDNFITLITNLREIKKSIVSGEDVLGFDTCQASITVVDKKLNEMPDSKLAFKERVKQWIEDLKDLLKDINPFVSEYDEAAQIVAQNAKKERKVERAKQQEKRTVKKQAKKDVSDTSELLEKIKGSTVSQGVGQSQ